MIKVVRGDIAQATEDIIGHLVSCKGIMGSSIAKQIKIAYPEAYTSYITLTNSEISVLGQAQFVRTKGKIIANLFGQKYFKRGILRTKQTTNMKALEKALIELRDFAEAHRYSVALPYRMNFSRSGAECRVVLKLIERVFSDYPVTLYSIIDVEKKSAVPVEENTLFSKRSSRK